MSREIARLGAVAWPRWSHQLANRVHRLATRQGDAVAERFLSLVEPDRAEGALAFAVAKQAQAVQGPAKLQWERTCALLAARARQNDTTPPVVKAEGAAPRE